MKLTFNKNIILILIIFVLGIGLGLNFNYFILGVNYERLNDGFATHHYHHYETCGSIIKPFIVNP